MRAALVHSIKSVRQVNTKYGEKVVAVIEIQGEPQQEFWMSLKQGERLSDCFDALQRQGGYSSKHAECHVVIDDSEGKNRFVWCGMHTPKRSDLDFLEDRFGVTCESQYIGRQSAVTDEADESLKD